MNKEELLAKIDKIFRANTIEEEREVGQFGQTKTVKVIEDIKELKNDIQELISSQFKIGEIDKKDVFIGDRKIGGSYRIDVPIEVAKKWGYKYILFNGTIYEFEGEDRIKDTGLTWGDL